MEVGKDSSIELPISPLTRRRFLGWLGWGSFALAMGGYCPKCPLLSEATIDL